MVQKPLQQNLEEFKSKLSPLPLFQRVFSNKDMANCLRTERSNPILPEDGPRRSLSPLV